MSPAEEQVRLALRIQILLGRIDAFLSSPSASNEEAALHSLPEIGKAISQYRVLDGECKKAVVA